MNENKVPSIFDQIERYVLNQMTQQERHMFESELNRNEKLRAEFAIQRELILSVQLGGMQETLKRIGAKISIAAAEQPVRSRGFIWGRAASIGVILGIAAWLALRPGESEKLYALYAINDPGLPVPMSAVDNYAFFDAMVDYKAGSFAKARSKFESLLILNSDSDTLHYFIGATYFGEGLYREALDQYQLPEVSNSATWAAKAQWYGLLSHLKLGNNDKVMAVETLENSSYASAIAEIKQKLAD